MPLSHLVTLSTVGMLATMLFYKHIHAKYTDKYHNSQLEAIAAIYTND